MEACLPLVPNLETIAYFRKASGMLDLPVPTTATALVYYHRFHAYMLTCKDKLQADNHHSMNAAQAMFTSEELLATTCLNLACKATEAHRKVRDVVNIGYKYFHPNEEELEIDKLYTNMKDALVTGELLLVRALDYELEVPLPFAFCLSTLRSMIPLPANAPPENLHKQSPEEKRRQQKKQWDDIQRDLRGPWSELARMACMFLWDSLCSPKMVIRHEPPALALGCLYLALRTSKVDMPMNMNEWVNICGASSNVSVRETQDVVADLLDFYSKTTID